MLQDKTLPEPWKSFFSDLDRMIDRSVELHCFGGFVIIHAYGVARTTNDCDCINIMPGPLRQIISRIAGQGSELHERHLVYLDPVTVANAPESYEDRLQPLFPEQWKHVKLLALEAHDLALAKLERNHERDRDDVQRLVRAGHLNRDILISRYYQELRPYLVNEARHDLTLKLWVESFWPEE